MGNATHWLIFFGIIGLVALALLVAFSAIIVCAVFLARSVVSKEGVDESLLKDDKTHRTGGGWLVSLVLLILVGPILGVAFGGALSLLDPPLVRGIPRVIFALTGGIFGALGSLCVLGVIRLYGRVRQPT